MPQVEVYHRGRSPDRRRLVRVLAGALTLLPAAAPAQQVEPSLWSRLQRIQEAFRAGDAEALRPSLPSRGKVRVDLADLAAGPGSYGRGQLEVLFARIFRENPTRGFAFQRSDVSLSPDGTAFARVTWTRGDERSPRKEVLTLTLRREGDDWRLREVLASR